MMNSTKASASAAIAILFVTAYAVVHDQLLSAHAFIDPSPFAAKRVPQRVSPTSPMTSSSLGTRRIDHPNNCLRSSSRPWNIFQMTATASNEDLEKEISAMRAKEIRQELESYGISTKSFFEKSELVDALVKARVEGKTPMNNVGAVNGDDSAASSNDNGSGTSSSSGGSNSSANRSERIKEEKEKCNKMKVGELKKELESYGISTKSFFEKSEFVQAVAEARVDGPPKKSGSSRAGGSSRSAKEEPRDPSYRDVVVTKFTGGKNLLGGKVIDVRAR